MSSSLLTKSNAVMALAGVLTFATLPVTALADTLIRYKAGETIELYGQSFVSKKDGEAYVSLSSEYLSVAVLSGKLKSGHATAGAGDILISTIESGKTRAYIYDAAKLQQTLNPGDLAEVAPILKPVIAKQKRARFFGLIEPVGVNAQTPASPAAEGLRRSYLSQAPVVKLRRQAGGDAGQLNLMTATAFLGAMAQGDADTVAALIDPKPFTDVSQDPGQWQAARKTFAEGLLASPALKKTFETAALSADPENVGMWLVAAPNLPAYRMRLVLRDRAAFVTALEPVS